MKSILLRHLMACAELSAALREEYPPGCRVRCFAKHGTPARYEGVVRPRVRDLEEGVFLRLETLPGRFMHINPHAFEIEKIK